MKAKQIIQIVCRMVVIIIALNSVCTMMACGTSDKTNPGGDVGQIPETAEDQYAIYGERSGEIISVLTEDASMEIYVFDNNGNEKTDDGDELNIQIDNHEVADDSGMTRYQVDLWMSDRYDLSSISSNKIYYLADYDAGTGLGSYFEIREPDGSNFTRYGVDSGYIIFSSLSGPENDAYAEGKYSITLEDGSKLEGQFGGVTSFDEWVHAY